MKKFLDRMKKNHEGFSLVELIVAIAILAIIFVPLLNAFVYSARTTRKAHSRGLETMAANNVYEGIRGASLSEVKKAAEDNDQDQLRADLGISDDQAQITLDDQDDESINMTISNYHVGNLTYNVNAVLDPSGQGAQDSSYFKSADPDNDPGVNDEALTAFTKFGRSYQQDTTDITNDPDKKTLPQAPENLFNDKKRTITVSFVVKDASGRERADGDPARDGDRVHPVISYKYYYKYKMTEDDPYEEDGPEEKIESISDFIYHPDEPFRIYIFYAPFYTAKGTGTIFNDDLRVDNKNLMKGTVCFVKQDTVSDRTQLSTYQTNYKGRVLIYEPGVTQEENAKMIVGTNMMLDLTADNSTNDDGTVLSGFSATLERHCSTRGQFEGSLPPAFNESLSAAPLIASSEGNRLYRVTIQVHDLDQSVWAAPLYTLNGIKLDG